jgi:aminomethyltransferase
MTDTPADLQRSPLDAVHRDLGARMGPFAGWSMPIEYAGTLAEHAAVRERVGLFDVTHLGKFGASGPGAFPALQLAFTNDLGKVPVGGAQYGMALNERGGIEDDLIVYRLGEQDWLVVPNAANVGRIFAAFSAQAGSAVDARVRDDLALLAVQGPRSFEVVTALWPEAEPLDYFRCARATWRDTSIVVSRTGYTGEWGYELFIPGEAAADVWREVMRRGEPFGIAPCGLGARDTLRLEMGYPLHGNDISPERTPLEARLGWAVSFDKGGFAGRDALVRQRAAGVPARLWGLRTEGRGAIPRPHYGVHADGERVGETTSGGFSPTLRAGIALAYLSPVDRFAEGDRVEVDVRGRRGPATVTRPPFVGSDPRRRGPA